MARRKVLTLSFSLLTAPCMLLAQFSSRSSFVAEGAGSDGGSGYERSVPYHPSPASFPGPFTRIAVGANVSPLGVGAQLSTNIAKNLNLRVSGSGYPYSTNFTTNGFSANAKLNLASAGIAADYYPFRFGFRISPGILVLNNNRLKATSAVAGGSSFTLNGDTFYSASANTATGATPLSGTAVLGLNSTKPAFTITGGWGNTIPRNGGHWAFPVEVGVALVGAPSLTANLNGWACYDQAQTQCSNVNSATNPLAIQIQSDLSAQVNKWKGDVNPLKTFPIVSAGLSYSFPVRGGGTQ